RAFEDRQAQYILNTWTLCEGNSPLPHAQSCSTARTSQSTVPSLPSFRTRRGCAQAIFSSAFLTSGLHAHATSVYIHAPPRRRHGPRERFPFIHRRPRIFPPRFYLPPHILESSEPTAEASLEHHFGGVANEPYETRKVPRPRRRQCVAHRQRRSQLSEIPQRQSRPERRQRGDQHARSHPKRQRWVSSSHTEAVDQPTPHCPPLRTHPSAPLGSPSRPPFVRPCPATPLSFSNPTRAAASRCILRQHKAPRLPRTLLTQLGILPRPRRQPAAVGARCRPPQLPVLPTQILPLPHAQPRSSPVPRHGPRKVRYPPAQVRPQGHSRARYG
ncbi:hypothetical protein B0H14DRAFT_3866709, partial [Mycena olivaceomarginata]